jgi:ribose-phosphate pyrophosphokinase
MQMQEGTMATATARAEQSSVEIGASKTTPSPVPAILLSGSANPGLTEAVERSLGCRFMATTCEMFPDGEVSARVDESVRGFEVVVLQPTSAPVNDHLVELLAIVDACRRAAATRIVAVVPYFGYARSDRRDGRRTAIMARLVADLMERAGIDHVITIDVHTPALEGFFRVPVDNITAVPVLADSLRSRVLPNAVIVSPDVGATRLANRYAMLLGLPVAICQKQRISGTEVSVKRIIGDVSGRPCVIVDDMITTGGTVVECLRALREAGAPSNAIVAATHAVLVPGAMKKLSAAGVQELVVTDSIAQATATESSPLRTAVVSVAPLIATAIRRLLAGGSLRELY